MEPSSDDAKITLPNFLKILTSNNTPMPKAMAIAGKVSVPDANPDICAVHIDNAFIRYKEYNTPSTLAQLTEVKLKAAGIDSQEDRKLTLNALRKAGYASKRKPLTKVKVAPIAEASGSQAPTSGSTSAAPTAVELLTTPTKRKRKKPDDTNEFLPSGPTEETDKVGSLDFGEVLDEEILKGKSTVINRAPVMMAWAMLIAERMHFSREEALSIASVYTEMNAVTKGVSLGIYNEDEDRGREASKDGPQPYVELMGRRPLYRTRAGQWRALANGNPTPPGTAFSYISRAFRQTTPHVIGALKLLADSYTAHELNNMAWSLYAEFRPEVNQWGKRSEIRCEDILELRKKNSLPVQEDVRLGSHENPMVNNVSSQGKLGTPDERTQKKARVLTLEEYEAALDLDTTFDNVNLDFLDTPITLGISSSSTD
ncbi:hypothetical protein GALMADRAFT_1338794 [Galerina marginata CBS 339.88]|uniref:Uncharacterized protein n=1 Tax=Galerina marginata (strain CBS 339.88) TaxID=685588 RepID=A0A067TKH9_GALM3|nr:hypothetical protein GALMADRAFT_1338794 [Galerina marginata CBS 339.88]